MPACWQTVVGFESRPQLFILKTIKIVPAASNSRFLHKCKSRENLIALKNLMICKVGTSRQMSCSQRFDCWTTWPIIGLKEYLLYISLSLNLCYVENHKTDRKNWHLIRHTCKQVLEIIREMDRKSSNLFHEKHIVALQI